MNMDEFLTKHRDEGGPGVDGLMSAAPWLSRARAAYWAREIAGHVRAGTYTAVRQWSIAEAIVKEKGKR